MVKPNFKKQRKLAAHLCLLILGSSLAFSALSAKTKKVIDAIVDNDYKAPVTPLSLKHDTKVIIDRYHNTIYKLPEEEQGTRIMLSIMQQDGFVVSYLDEYQEKTLALHDILIIHGLPYDKVNLTDELSYWKSPLSANTIDQIVRWVANGGGLFLTLSHHPNGSGAKPLLDAFDVKFRDGYLYSPTYPSFISKEDRCSHFFGMSDDLINQTHPIMAMGEKVEKIDFLCGAAVFREPDDVIIGFPGDSGNFDGKDRLLEKSEIYAGLIGFQYGKGKVVVATDQGMFRNFVFTFDSGEKVHVTLTSKDNDNAKLFANLMRWLSPKLENKMGK